LTAENFHTRRHGNGKLVAAKDNSPEKGRGDGKEKPIEGSCKQKSFSRMTKLMKSVGGGGGSDGGFLRPNLVPLFIYAFSRDLFSLKKAEGSS